jgi:RNA polymerase sigma factor (sigma-70 family)
VLPDDIDQTITPETLTTAELARLCAEETSRYLRNETIQDCYGLELFRRAIRQRDDDAWAAIYERYAGLVRHWLGPAADEGEEAVATTFVRFWRAMSAEKVDRFASLAALLQYLKRCAQATRLDRERSARARLREEPLGNVVDLLPLPDEVEATVAAQAEAESLWLAVHGCLEDRQERAVVYLSYVAGLTPREIHQRFGGQFSSLDEVYRLKRRALDRLRRGFARCGHAGSQTRMVVARSAR